VGFAIVAAMRRIAALSLPALVAGLVATVMAVSDRDRDPAFALDQRQPRAIEAQALERTVILAPEPVPTGDGQPGLSATCTPGTQDGELRNPWRCRVRYRKRHFISYVIRIRNDGTFRGTSPGGTRDISGRVGVPAAS
jgi:hypothetical protein